MNYTTAYLLSLSITIPALVGFVLFKKLSQQFKIIAVLMSVGLLTELCLIVTAQKGMSNLYIIDAYTGIEIFLLTLYFSIILYNPIIVSFFKLTCVLILILVVSELFFIGLDKWIDLSSVVESIFLITAGLYYFYEVAMGINLDRIPQSYDFWFTGVLLFYLMSSLEYFLLSHYLSTVSPKSLLMLGDIHTFVNAFCNLAYALVLWKSTRSCSSVQ